MRDVALDDDEPSDEDAKDDELLGGESSDAVEEDVDAVEDDEEEDDDAARDFADNGGGDDGDDDDDDGVDPNDEDMPPPQKEKGQLQLQQLPLARPHPRLPIPNLPIRLSRQGRSRRPFSPRQGGTPHESATAETTPDTATAGTVRAAGRGRR